MQILGFKANIKEMEQVNEDVLEKLEEKERVIQRLEGTEDGDSGEKVKKLEEENEILAAQIREMQEEMAESSNMSKLQNKNLSSMEIANELLNQQVKNLHQEREKLLKIVSEGNQGDKLDQNRAQIQSNLQGIAKVMNKNNKLKESLSIKNKDFEYLQNETSRLSQLLELKEKECASFQSQNQELQLTFTSELAQKETFFIEKTKGTYLSLYSPL